MTMRLIEKINDLRVNEHHIALFFLGQAGIVLKTADNKLIVIDAYLSDAVERLFGFKRMIPSLLEAGELDADLYISTHAHADHLDPDSLPEVVKNEKTLFIGSPDCEELYLQHNLTKERYKILKEGEGCEIYGVRLKAIYADHGDLAPEAGGILVEIDGFKIYHTGDTSFCPDRIKSSLNTDVDIMIAPINGQYGNMNGKEAADLTAAIKPKIVIASHYWMFLEHVCEGGKGDPTTFLNEAATLPHDIKPMVMAPGDLLVYPEDEKIA